MHIQALTSIAEKYRSISQLCRGSENIVKENKKTTDDIILRVMIIENLVLIPMDDEKEEIEKLANSNFTTMEEAMRKLYHLAEMYDELGRIVEKVSM